MIGRAPVGDTLLHSWTATEQRPEDHITGADLIIRRLLVRKEELIDVSGEYALHRHYV
jgi:hypothetical protein